MIKHIFMASVKSDTTQEIIEEILKGYRSFSDLIPEISQITVGKNLGWYDSKITVAFIAEFIDETSWKLFMDNPDHLRIGYAAFEFLDPTSVVVAQISE